MPETTAPNLTTFADQWQPEPLIVVVRVTSRCGLACHYCGFSRDVLRTRSDIDPNHLLAFGRGLAEYQHVTGRTVLVSWLGGEPYGWRDLWLISREFCHSLGLALGITTAGTALAGRAMRQATIDCFRELTLSVDGTADTHDGLRPAPGGYAQLRQNCLRLRDEDTTARLKLRVNMVLTRSNIAKFAEACHELATWGIDEISFNQLGGNDRPEFYPQNRLQADQFAEFLEQLPPLTEELSERGLKITGGHAYLDRIHATIHGQSLPIDDCQPASRFLFVDEFGRVSPCSFTSHVYAVPISELTTARAVAELPERLKRLRRNSSCAACTDCHATHMFDKFAAKPKCVSTGRP